MDEQEKDKRTPIHPWGVGGPKTAEHRALAKQWFLEGLAEFHAVTQACEYAGIVRNTAYAWKEKDKKFSDSWDRSVERSRDIARASIFQRGILGWEERAYSNGQPVYEYELVLDEKGEPKFDEKGKPIYKRGELFTVHKWSDSLAALYARANLPEYKEKQQIDLAVTYKEQAEKAKQELLAGLDDEDKKPSDKEDTHT